MRIDIKVCKYVSMNVIVIVLYCIVFIIFPFLPPCTLFFTLLPLAPKVCKKSANFLPWLIYKFHAKQPKIVKIAKKFTSGPTLSAFVIPFRFTESVNSPCPVARCESVHALFFLVLLFFHLT